MIGTLEHGEGDSDGSERARRLRITWRRAGSDGRAAASGSWMRSVCRASWGWRNAHQTMAAYRLCGVSGSSPLAAAGAAGIGGRNARENEMKHMTLAALLSAILAPAALAQTPPAAPPAPAPLQVAEPDLRLDSARDHGQQAGCRSLEAHRQVLRYRRMVPHPTADYAGKEDEFGAVRSVATRFPSARPSSRTPTPSRCVPAVRTTSITARSRHDR